MITFGKGCTILSVVLALLFVLATVGHRLQLDMDHPATYRDSPLTAVVVLTMLALLGAHLLQAVALIGLIVKRADAGRWPLYAGLTMLLLIVASITGCVVDSPTLVYAT